MTGAALFQAVLAALGCAHAAEAVEAHPSGGQVWSVAARPGSDLVVLGSDIGAHPWRAGSATPDRVVVLRSWVRSSILRHWIRISASTPHVMSTSTTSPTTTRRRTALSPETYR